MKKSDKRMLCRYFERNKTFGLPWGNAKSMVLGAILSGIYFYCLVLAVGETLPVLFQ